MVEELTFNLLGDRNESRANRWHPGFPDTQDWTLGDWGNAMAGEAGEACNVIKKIRRVQTGKVGREAEASIAALRPKLASELADLIIYADLIATMAGIDLEEAIVVKFNEVSEQYGFPERL